MRDTASFVVAGTAVDPMRVSQDESTIRVWMPGERLVVRRPHQARRALCRHIAAELGFPLSANPVLRARFAARDRAPRIAWFAIGALFAVGASFALLAVSDGGKASSPAPASIPAVIPAATSSAAASELPRTIELPADVAPVRTLNVMTTVEIQTSYAAPEPSYQRGRESRAEQRKHPLRRSARPAKQSKPTAAASAAKPPIDDNPYQAVAAPVPTVSENPY